MNKFMIDFENKLRSVIEGQIFNQSSEVITVDKISHMISNAFQKELEMQKTNSDGTININNFVISVHPTILKFWKNEPDFLQLLNKAFQQITSEAGFHFSHPVSLSLTSDASLALEDVIIFSPNQSEIERTSLIKVEQTDKKQYAAFLIVDGRNIINITGNITTIGRREGNDILINDPRVSRDHAQIRFDKDHFILFDLQSTGGTFVNDQRIDQINLYAGDVLSLAGYKIIFGHDNESDNLSKGETLRMKSIDPKPLSETDGIVPTEKKKE